MNHRNPSSLRALLLLLVLVVGPLQAQTVFACAMMDTVMHDECCCDEHEVNEDCADSDCDAALEDPCCERTVAVSIDEDARQDSPIVKPVEVRSDVDPPQAIIASFDALVPPQSVVALGVFQPRPIASQSGSKTYLITQRLRI